MSGRERKDYIAEPDCIEVRQWDGEYHRNGDKIKLYDVKLKDGIPYLVRSGKRIEKNCMTDEEAKEF